MECKCGKTACGGHLQGGPVARGRAADAYYERVERAHRRFLREDPLARDDADHAVAAYMRALDYEFPPDPETEEDSVTEEDDDEDMAAPPVLNMVAGGVALYCCTYCKRVNPCGNKWCTKVKEIDDAIDLRCPDWKKRE